MLSRSVEALHLPPVGLAGLHQRAQHALRRHAAEDEAVAAVVIRDQAASLSEAEVLDHLKARLARYKLPRRVLFLDDLPRNAMGKVQKNKLREIHWDIFAPNR